MAFVGVGAVKSYASFLLILLAIFWLNQGHGQVLFGPEFTFTNAKIIQASSRSDKTVTSVQYVYLEKWQALADRQCQQSKPACKTQWTYDKHGEAFRVTFADGFWYQVSCDKNVLEVQTLRSTIETFKEKQALLQERVFATALTLGLTPHERLGGGHISVDEATGIQANFLLYWNFIADFANHPELTYGIFGGHLGNAPPIAALDESSIAAFKKIFGTSQMESQSKYVEFLNLDDSYEARVLRLTNLIQDTVYTSNPYGWAAFYYQALRLSGMIYTNLNEGQRRIELRNFRPQRSLEEFILQIEFLEARLRYLGQLESPLPVKIARNWDVPLAIKVERFQRVLKEMNLDESKFSTLIPNCANSLHGRSVIP